MGPVTVGYTKGDQTGGVQGSDAHQMEAMGIALSLIHISEPTRPY